MMQPANNQPPDKPTVTDAISADATVSLLLQGAVLLDVRAEQEFVRGSVPNAYNLPILKNAERKTVGICYKKQGQVAAIALGHELVHGDVKTERCTAWAKLVQRQKNTALFCWRGGLRSELAARWLAEVGIAVPRVSGGYKAIRQALTGILTQQPRQRLILLGGHTGSGKTNILAHLSNSIDLEALAHHRGSAFGAHPQPQPTIIDFENKLALELLRHQNTPCLVLEDEGRCIGHLQLPKKLHDTMQQAKLVVLKVALEQRVQLIFESYIARDLQSYLSHKNNPVETFCKRLQEALFRIRKRLGGLRYSELDRLMQRAFQHQRWTGELDAHRDWIKGLLMSYYDPMYEYQLQKKADRILFQGDSKAVLNYFSELVGLTNLPLLIH